jgi:hypothetical protein
MFQSSWFEIALNDDADYSRAINDDGGSLRSVFRLQGCYHKTSLVTSFRGARACGSWKWKEMRCVGNKEPSVSESEYKSGEQFPAQADRTQKAILRLRLHAKQTHGLSWHMPSLGV